MQANWNEWLEAMMGKQFSNAWAFPTADSEQLAKKINELRSVLGWLQLQSKFLETTIHSMEVQYNTLQALSSLNLSPDQVQAAVSKAGKESAAGLGEVFAPLQQFWGKSAENLGENINKIFAAGQESAVKSTPKTPTKRARNKA